MKKKKIINLFVGSNNQGKIKEIRDLLPKTVQILTPKYFNLKSLGLNTLYLLGNKSLISFIFPALLDPMIISLFFFLYI